MAGEATLDLPSVVPDLSRQTSFEPVTQKTTWQMIQVERQKSSEKQRKGRNIVLDVSSDVHLYFVKAPKASSPQTEVYLPRVVPAEVMALEQKPLTLIFEYADLFLTQWNSHKKGVGLYKSIREKKMNHTKDVFKHMDNSMCRAFQIKKKHLLSDDACATAASYLQLVMVLEAIDVHDAVVTGDHIVLYCTKRTHTHTHTHARARAHALTQSHLYLRLQYHPQAILRPVRSKS